MRSRVLKLWIRLNDIFKNRNFFVPYCGKKLFINTNNSLLNQLLNSKDGYYETNLIENIASEIGNINKGDLFIDVGANVGFISLHAQQRLNNISIIAFEPGPSQYKYFSKTLEYNKISNIALNNIALSNKSGEATFIVHSKEHNSGDGFIDTGRAGEGEEIIVKTETLDNFLKITSNQNRVKVIKIDTEGAELFVLEGAVETIKKYFPVIYLEIWQDNLKNYPYTVNDLFLFFEKLNYQLFTLDGDIVNEKTYFQFQNKESMYKAKLKS